MAYIFTHGLGQDAKAWDSVIKELDINGQVIVPNLNDIMNDDKFTYQRLYDVFSKVCDEQTERLQLCGLSLGAILSLHYAIDNPDKVESLVLIGAQYKIPKNLFKIQNIMFKLMPKSMFKKMGFTKEDILTLTKSMVDLDFSNELKAVKCPTLVICGSKDTANLKASNLLHELLEDSELEIIEGAKHELNVEKPKELSSVLNKYYKKK